ncbi:hypothetical protein ANO11243_027730 [Dothideomycetidae sp. 11243]|nr:hypothetical protein ANO11243_027730 [fungal sp. No.11243]
MPGSERSRGSIDALGGVRARGNSGVLSILPGRLRRQGKDAHSTSGARGGGAVDAWWDPVQRTCESITLLSVHWQPTLKLCLATRAAAVQNLSLVCAYQHTAGFAICLSSARLNSSALVHVNLAGRLLPREKSDILLRCSPAFVWPPSSAILSHLLTGLVPTAPTARSRSGAAASLITADPPPDCQTRTDRLEACGGRLVETWDESGTNRACDRAVYAWLYSPLPYC